jgi:hypothetical protein
MNQQQANNRRGNSALKFLLAFLVATAFWVWLQSLQPRSNVAVTFLHYTNIDHRVVALFRISNNTKQPVLYEVAGFSEYGSNIDRTIVPNGKALTSVIPPTSMRTWHLTVNYWYPLRVSLLERIRGLQWRANESLVFRIGSAPECSATEGIEPSKNVGAVLTIDHETK